jgi:hypothetical protein
MSPGLDDFYSSNMKAIFTVLCIYAGNQNVSISVIVSFAKSSLGHHWYFVTLNLS